MKTETKTIYPKSGIAKLLVAICCLLFFGFRANIPDQEIVKIPLALHFMAKILVVGVGLLIISKTIHDKRKALSIGTLSIIFWIVVSISMQIVISYLVWGDPDSDYKNMWINLYRYKNVLSEMIGLTLSIAFGYAQVVGTTRSTKHE